MQYTVDELATLAERLPGEKWAVKQTTRSERTADGIYAKVSEVNIIGPGNHMAGRWVEGTVMTYRPSGTVSYWYIKQMALAGWVEAELLPRYNASGQEEDPS